MGDRVDAEIWYNETRFEGDTLKSGKARQIPTLPTVLYSPSGTDGFAITDAEGSSMGARWETTFGRPDQVQSSFGVDVTHVRQALNDIEPLLDIDSLATTTFRFLRRTQRTLGCTGTKSLRSVIHLQSPVEHASTLF
jgi:hypothetical protein